MALTQQPQTMQMNQTQFGMGPLGVPPGLEYFASADGIFVKQQKELAEILTGCEMKNKYKILNKQGQHVYFCFEESDTCNRLLCGPNRGFTFHVQDNNNREVLSMTREFQCCVGMPCCADGGCAYPIDIYDGQRQKIGMMRMTNFCCSPRFGIFDTENRQLYQIYGDCCRCQCPGCCPDDVNFPVMSVSDSNMPNVANVARKCRGFITEFLSDADSYNVTFPVDMHVVHKALIFASTFLIDITLYEQQQSG